MNLLARIVFTLLPPPEPSMITLAGESERLVAKARLIIISLLLITPTLKMYWHSNVPVFFWGFWILMASLASAVAIYLALKRHGYSPWIGLSSSILDGTFVSTALLLFMFVGSPLIGINSKVTFEIYFLIIIATTLRYDPRISMTTGLILTAQYGGLWWYAATHWDLNQPGIAGGPYQWWDQLTRIILLFSTTLLGYFAVSRIKKIVYESIHDGLTGTFSRGYFYNHIKYEFDRANRKQHPIVVAMVDADNFKSINDRYGHKAGDEVLRAMSLVLRDNLRRTDMVARYGGEEFVLMFPEVDVDEILPKLEQLRKYLADKPLQLSTGEEIAITFSAGVACYPVDGKTPADVIDAADQRLLLAKRGGRNRIVKG